MAGRNVFRSELISAIDQPAKLEILIAHHARIGCAAGLVLVSEILNDLGLELFGFVDEIVWHAELMANRARVRDRLRTAAFIFGARHAILRPKLQGNTDDIVALLKQKRSGRGGIDSSAHADYHARFCLN